MADISIRQSHQLTAGKARVAAEKVADEMTSEFDMACVWEGDVLSFKRSGVSGTLALEGQEVQLDITLGFMLKAFAGKIEEKVSENMTKVFASGPVA
ncbi:MAG: polyhydroxyalkanoic acid system family protein [Herminiimonas sp.]|nr:polyhydroxyalkanoic acid system family protein [Herminiimonas sp.]